MDKTYQDLHVKIGDDEVFTLRCIELLEFVKRPKALLFRYITFTPKREQELLIPIVRHMAIIID